MALIDKRMIEYGPGALQVNLGSIPDTAGHDSVALTNVNQSITGIKTFSEIVTSPNSGEKITDEMPETELLTHQQLSDYKNKIEEKTPRVSGFSLTPSSIEVPEGYIVRVIDAESGTLIGTTWAGGGGVYGDNRPSNSGGGSVPVHTNQPSNTPPEYSLSPAPNQSTVLPPGASFEIINGKPYIKTPNK